ncbi:MAG: hypothetical protein P8049_10055 [Gemmatimonadota bacterium]
MIKNFLARIGCLTVIAVTALGAWHYRDAISASLGRVEIGISTSEPSEGLARQAEEKLLSLSTSESAAVSLSAAELQSLLTYRVAPQLPDGLEQPLVDLRDSVLIVSAVVLPDRLEAYGALVVPAMMVPFVLQGIEIPGVDASGSDLLIPLPARVAAIDLEDGRLTIRMNVAGD